MPTTTPLCQRARYRRLAPRPVRSEPVRQMATTPPRCVLYDVGLPQQLVSGPRSRRPPPAPASAPPELPADHVSTLTAAKHLGVSQSTVKRRCAEGKIPGVFRFAHGAHWLISRRELEALTGRAVADDDSDD